MGSKEGERKEGRKGEESEARREDDVGARTQEHVCHWDSESKLRRS